MSDENSRIYLESDKLKLILSEHRDDIGRTKKEAVGTKTPR